MFGFFIIIAPAEGSAFSDFIHDGYFIFMESALATYSSRFFIILKIIEGADFEVTGWSAATRFLVSVTNCFEIVKTD